MRISMMDALVISWVFAWVIGLSVAMALMTYKRRKK